LAEAGFPNGFETTFSFRDVTRIYVAHQPQVAQEIQAQLAEIGIKIKITPEESGTFLENVAAGKEPFFMLGWGMDYPDATNFYDFHFTGGVPRFGKEWDDVISEIKAAAQIADPAERQTHYDKVAALIKEHVPMIPVAHGAAADVFSKSVGNVKIGALNENFQEMTTDDGQLVWIQGAEPISLWCGDETDGETLRACLQLYNSLLGYEFGGTKAVPALAESWDASPDAVEAAVTGLTHAVLDGRDMHFNPHLKSRGLIEPVEYPPERGMGPRRLIVGRPWRFSKMSPRVRGPAAG